MISSVSQAAYPLEKGKTQAMKSDKSNNVVAKMQTKANAKLRYNSSEMISSVSQAAYPLEKGKTRPEPPEKFAALITSLTAFMAGTCWLGPSNSRWTNSMVNIWTVGAGVPHSSDPSKRKSIR